MCLFLDLDIIGGLWTHTDLKAPSLRALFVILFYVLWHGHLIFIRLQHSFRHGLSE